MQNYRLRRTSASQPQSASPINLDTEFLSIHRKDGYVQGLAEKRHVGDTLECFVSPKRSNLVGKLTSTRCSSLGGQITPFASRTFQYTKEQLGQAEDKVCSSQACIV